MREQLKMIVIKANPLCTFKSPKKLVTSASINNIKKVQIQKDIAAALINNQDWRIFIIYLVVEG